MPKEATKPATVGHNAEVNVKSLITRLCKLLDEKDELGEDIKQLKKDAKASGLNMKALAIAIKEIRNPIDEELKINANSYIEASGQHALFV